MKDHEQKGLPDLKRAMTQAMQIGQGCSVEIDVARYQAYLEDEALSPAQKEEIIHALWTILSSFVELGFGVHPTQQSCGQVEDALEAPGDPGSDLVDSEETEIRKDFNEAPGRK
ncbi:MAG: hypothetical protein AAGH74_02230 [Pseudomonadota bacterium]